MSKTKIKKYADYLYYLELERYNYEPMPDNDGPLFTGGCSSIRKSNLYGRNLDLNYCDTPEFVIRLQGSEKNFASIGVCANPSITADVSQMNDEDFLLMPCITNDGINENGVIVSVNVVKTNGIDKMDHTALGKNKIHASRIVRYLLDNSKSADHAVELMKDVDIVGGFSGFGLHWMIADKENTYVAEIINRKLVFSKNRHFIMTNFYLNYGPEIKKQYFAENEFENIPLLNKYAIGVERYDVIKKMFNSIDNIEDMKNVLKTVKATAVYHRPVQDRWYSEFTDDGLDINSKRKAFDEEYSRQIELYKTRDRKNPKGDWISWHSSIYEISEKRLILYSQEDYEASYCFVLND